MAKGHPQKEFLKSALTFKNAIQKYFDYIDENPWNHPDKYRQEQIVLAVPRPYLIQGLCNHLGMSRRHWYALQDLNHTAYREDLRDTFDWANSMIYERNVTGAACNTYNHNIVSRILGLTDKREVTTDMQQKVKEDAQKVMDKLLS